MDDAVNVVVDQAKEPVDGSIGEKPAESKNGPGLFKGKKKIGLIAGVAILAIIVVVAFVALGGKSGSASGSAKSNLFSQGLVSASTGGKWGYVDKTGAYVINPQFEGCGQFASNGLAGAKSGGKYGYIDKKGSFVINPQFDGAYPFTEDGFATVKVGEKWGCIDKKGSYVINPQFDRPILFDENGFACVESDGKYGYIDKTGTFVINPQFDSADSFYDGYDNVAVVEVGDKYGIIDAKGKYILNPTYSYIEIAGSGMLRFTGENGKIGYLNTSGKIVVPAQFDDLTGLKYSTFAIAGSFYGDGYAVVRTGNVFGVIDRTGKYVANPQFDGLYAWSANK